MHNPDITNEIFAPDAKLWQQDKKNIDQLINSTSTISFDIAYFYNGQMLGGFLTTYLIGHFPPKIK